MKWLAILAILVIFAPIAVYAQAPQNTILISGDATSVRVTIQGQVVDDGVINLTIRGSFGSESMKEYHESYTVSDNNPSHVFELDYPFKSNEEYTATVRNGYTSNVITWVPLPSVQETPEQTEPVVEQETSQESVEEAPIATTPEKQTSDSQSLIEENEFLTQEIEKKDAVIMEQVKVIMDLASKVTNAVYEKQSDNLFFIAENDNSFDSLMEENKFLKQEIDKKDAVIMEQVKVIMDLASKVTSTNYFSSSTNLESL